MTGRRTRAERDRLIEEAIAFIQAAEKEAELAFCLEVGEHLFRGLFGNDLELFRSTSRWKEQSLRRIAADPRVNLPAEVLSNSVHTYIVLRVLKQRRNATRVPDISPWTWGETWALVDDPGILVAVLDWVVRRKVGRETVREVVQIVAPYIEAGGRIEDLLVDQEVVKRADARYRMSRRMLGVERKWILAASGIPEDTVQDLLSIIDEILAILDKGR